jgi:hypothetical protein
MFGRQRQHDGNGAAHHTKTAAPAARHCVTMVAAVAVWSVLLTGVSAAAQTHTGGGAHGARPGGGWGKAEEVPGFAALNTDGVAEVNSVSCGSAGDCSAGGSYLDSSDFTQAFVVSQVHGVWGKAEEVPGTAALNKGGDANVLSVSCPSAANCSAVGYFAYSNDGMGDSLTQAFVVSEINGTWGKAEVVPGLTALNTGGFAQFNSVSCASAGNCSAGGAYDHRPAIQAFVDSEVDGRWGKAEEVPGLAALNKGGSARIDWVSCASAGNCSAVGGYRADSAGHEQLFVVSQINGRWRRAEEVPGLAALNRGGYAEVTPVSVSCASAGNCSAGGTYTDSSGNAQPFVDSQINGRWRKAEQVPGLAALNKGSNAGMYSVSCASAGNCSAGGYYTDSSTCTIQRCFVQAFVISQVNGRWRTPEEVPGLAALNKGNLAEITSVSCASADHCSAAGTYAQTSHTGQAFS